MQSSTRNNISIICWLAVLFGFGMMPGSFFNYGWNYWQFLPWAASVAILAVTVAVLWTPERFMEGSGWRGALLLSLLPVAAVSAFWFFRTQIHCFGGDGAVGIVPSGIISLQDFIPPMPGKRLDGYLSGVIGKLCNNWGIFNSSEVMPSILSTQIYTTAVGAIFVCVATLSLRKTPWILAVILTYPFIFNFFGNIDSYAFSLLVALVFMILAMHVDRSQRVGFGQIIPLGIAWGIGLWTHPFHVFSGFVMAVEGTRFLKGFRPLARLPDWLLPAMYGVVLFAVVKCSPWSNSFFAAEAGKTPPSFSVDTLTHYVNMILLPIAPLVVGSILARGSVGRLKAKSVVFLMQSAVFFIMAFTLGACDQFNYQHLLLFFVTPWIVIGGTGLPRGSLKAVVATNLFLILPMIAVHSTSRTIDRALAVYPMDPCQHNTVMSWQTHLGLVLGDNLQTEPSVKKACLHVFENGARHAMPPAFRGGNYIYHAAFLYHFGEFERGRSELFGILKQNPQVFQSLLTVRPGFIYCNRERLWTDMELFLRQARHPKAKEFIKVKESLIKKAAEEPYYLHRPSYAQTEV